MKKTVLFIVLFQIVMFGHSDSVNWSPYFSPSEQTSMIYRDDEVYCWFSFHVQWIKVIKNQRIEEDGFVKLMDKIIPQTDGLYVLEGKNIILFEQYFFPWNRATYSYDTVSIYDAPMIYTDIFLEEWHNKKYSRTTAHITKAGWNKVILYEDGINSILASSFLKEKSKDGSIVSYEGENLKDTLFFVTGDGTVDLYYDNKTPPWVEGVEGYGIGEYLDIEFKYASDEIQILNGFVDFSRMHLYKDNSRVKRIRIESREPAFSQEYELEDIVRYNLIPLPEKTAKIRMTILDVYPGRKWQDTCLSSILVTDPNQPPYEEQKTKIISLMKERGVWQKIEEFKKQLRKEPK